MVKRKQKKNTTKPKVTRIYMSETEYDKASFAYADTFHKSHIRSGVFTQDFIKFSNAFVMGLRSNKKKK